MSLHKLCWNLLPTRRRWQVRTAVPRSEPVATRKIVAAPIAVASLSVSAAFQAHRHLGASRSSGAWLSTFQDSQSNDFRGERTTRMTAAVDVLRGTVRFTAKQAAMNAAMDVLRGTVMITAKQAAMNAAVDVLRGTVMVPVKQAATNAAMDVLRGTVMFTAKQAAMNAAMDVLRGTVMTTAKQAAINAAMNVLTVEQSGYSPWGNQYGNCGAINVLTVEQSMYSLCSNRYAFKYSIHATVWQPIQSI